MSEDVLDSIKEQISENPIILYMKGSPQAPQCGFSAQTVQCMVACGQRFAYVDILSNPEIRATLPGYANWPTFPQLWVDGELVGGCDIITEMFEAGELEPLLVKNSKKYPAEGESEEARPLLRAVPANGDGTATRSRYDKTILRCALQRMMRCAPERR